MSRTMDNEVSRVIAKALRTGLGSVNGRYWNTTERREKFRAEYNKDSNRLDFYHWGTCTLRVDLSKKQILGWDGWSNSDRDSLNAALSELNINGWYFKVKNNGLQLIHAGGTVDPTLLEVYSKDMTIDDGEAAKARKRKVDNFVKEMGRRIVASEVSDGGGECWKVSMFPGEQCSSCDFLADNECGGGKVLIQKALRESGYRDAMLYIATVDAAAMRREKTIILRALRKYLYQRVQG